ncbi:helix-turn-helix domain-containing protein [Citrobacter farmeri]|uniref:helix-turn-helix domain-containing protein n=1 Tax=Citrobacter amalonaticus TaxID=35703 RepID=UPI0002B61944|nr:helix-turn-helix domain-containing protein [Citrobacter amalonaticus]EKV5654312.1 helix-turn-helix domain-containing protein [Citrobacter farmeri]
MSHHLDITAMSGSLYTRVDSSYLTILLDTLEPYLTYNICPVGKRFSFNATRQSKCYVVRRGVISLIRQPDDILLDIFEGPTLRGIIPVHETSDSQHIMRVLEPAKIAIVDKEEWYSLLTQHDLWQPYAMHLQLMLGVGAEVLFKHMAPTVFERVRYQLCELMSKPLTVRESITAESYIRSKTRLSRSAIMKTLSALREGGYICMENGYLKEIKKIPVHF